jgi:AraC-like DNA-binding protein
LAVTSLTNTISHEKRSLGSIHDLYQLAEREVRAAGYDWEIKWQKSLDFKSFSETDFLREAAWVILCSGFKESTVRKHFDYISMCFCDWESSYEIISHRELCVTTAFSCFRNKNKLNAIAKIAEIIDHHGFSNFKLMVQQDPILKLMELPFIGPITSWHLAKNLGLNVAKNDRHLLRIANHFGYSDSHSLCAKLSEYTGVSSSVIDIVLWRFATISLSSQFS